MLPERGRDVEKHAVARAQSLRDQQTECSFRPKLDARSEVLASKRRDLSRPISEQLVEAQAEYAALDVSYLHPIGLQLQERAADMGRMAWILEDGARMRPGGKAPITKFKNAYRLAPDQQRVLSALVEWREAEARERDRPRSWILSDKVLTALARTLPASVKALSRVEDMPQGLVRRAGDKLVALMSAAIEGSDDEVPAAIVPPLSSAERKQLGGLSDHLRSIAESMDVPPEVLMPKADLEQLIRLQAEPSLDSPDAWGGWRATQVVEPLREWLDERGVS